MRHDLAEVERDAGDAAACEDIRRQAAGNGPAPAGSVIGDVSVKVSPFSVTRTVSTPSA
jgi:hypothetical protein